MGQINNKGFLILMQLMAGVVILLLCCTAVSAAPKDESDFSMGVPEVRLVNVEPGSIHFDPDIGEMLDGWTHVKDITAVVSANANWVLTIKGSEEYWEGPYDKPVSDIYWNLAGGEYKPLSTQSTPVVSGGLSKRCGYPVHIKIKLDLSKDQPGDYNYYYIIFELTAP